MLDSLFTIFYHDCFIAEFLDHFSCDFLVDDVVFCDENSFYALTR